MRSGAEERDGVWTSSTVRRHDTQLGVFVGCVLVEVGEVVVGEAVVGAQLGLGQVARESGIGGSARLIGRVRRRVVLRADGSRGASAQLGRALG